MTKRLSKASIVVLVCFVSAIAISAEKAISERKVVAVERAKPQKSASVAVEAYLVQVSAKSLREVGVSVIPSKSEEAISIPKLLSCMTAGKGALISSTRLVVRENEEAKSTITNTYNLRLPATTKTKKGPEESYRIHQYNSGTTTTVTIHVADDGLLRIQLSFDHSGLTFDMADNDKVKESIPPDLVSYKLTGIFDIKVGRSVIVGSEQSGDKGLFLVVRAEILK